MPATAGRHGCEALQEACAIGVDADVTQPLTFCRHAIVLAGEAVAVPGNRRTAEIQRVAAGRAHQLHHVGIEQVVRVVHRRGQRGHLGTGALQQICNSADARSRRKRLVALQIDHAGLVVPSGNARAFGKAVGAGKMRGAGHRHMHSWQMLDRRYDTRVVGGHPHLARTRQQCTLGHVLDHRSIADQLQRFTRQPRGSVTGGNGDNEIGRRGGCHTCALWMQ